MTFGVDTIMECAKFDGSAERECVARSLEQLADEAIEKIDGGEECQAHDSWLTTISIGMRHAAILLRSTK